MTLKNNKIADTVWKVIEGFPRYEVSNQGEIRIINYRNLGYPRILKTRKSHNGYDIVNLYNDGKMKTVKVHRTVAIAFIPNPENKLRVNHINERKDDNRAENLNWMTDEENANHGTRNKRISESQKGRTQKPWTDEMRKNQSKRMMGSNNNFYGKTHTEETKRKISEAKKKK